MPNKIDYFSFFLSDFFLKEKLSLPTALREAQSIGIQVTQRPILRFFTPRGQHVATMGLKFALPSPYQISTPSVQCLGYRTPKLKFLEI